MVNFNMRLMRNCFGCFDLRTGVLILAIAEVIMGLYGVFHGARELKTLADDDDAAGRMTPSNATQVVAADKKRTNQVASIASIVVSCLDVLISVLLLVCAALNQPKYRNFCLVWIGWAIMTILLLIVTLVLYAIGGSHIIHHLITLGSIVMYVIFVYVVFSYFVLLRTQAQAGNFQVFYNQQQGSHSGVDEHSSHGTADSEYGLPPPYEATTFEHGKA